MSTPLTVAQYEQLQPVASIDYNGIQLRFSVPSAKALYRVETLLEKEPDTIKWISGFHPSDVFFDIGANVGIYTVWAAVTKRMQVFAFEPESSNYAVLNKNIELNKLSDSVSAYCMAISDSLLVNHLHLGMVEIGGSLHAFQDSVDFKLEPFKAAFRQGCVSFSLDVLIDQFQIPVPNHIKIDVDGIEHRVITGAEKLLRNPKLKSVLIELNTNLVEHRTMKQKMFDCGFQLPPGEEERSIKKSGAFVGLGNLIFYREIPA